MPKARTDPKPAFCAASRQEWRSWLEKHHTRESQVWLVYFKKHTGKPSLSYTESLEEALCFGWVDGIKRRIDEERYAHRFSPRRQKSRWSPTNILLARRLIAEGKMTPVGLDSFNRRVSYDDEFVKAKKASVISLGSELERRLRANKAAWRFFNDLAPGYKRQYIDWLVSAKKSLTRERRLTEAIKLLADNKKLGMK